MTFDSTKRFSNPSKTLNPGKWKCISASTSSRSSEAHDLQMKLVIGFSLAFIISLIAKTYPVEYAVPSNLDPVGEDHKMAPLHPD